MKTGKNLEYFKKDDVLWFNIKEGVEFDSVEIAPNITVELDRNNEIIGIEILNASKHFKRNVINRLKKDESHAGKKTATKETA